MIYILSYVVFVSLRFEILGVLLAFDNRASILGPISKILAFKVEV